LPSSTEWPRPQYGQMWSWEGNPPFMLLRPIGGGPFSSTWVVINLHYREAEPYEMHGLYADRNPIRGYTFIGGPTA
jgi:hypothetical protein